jgi:ubiquinone/menaquinone biosynthesis C-methylase UbiE
MNSVERDARDLWNGRAAEWQVQVGTDGDANRRFFSDPVLWRLLGGVDGLRVLDAGCGTGYLARALADRGASVTAVDWAEAMTEACRRAAPMVDCRTLSCSDLAGLPDAGFDRVVSNYVLMDTPDLDGAVSEFFRVLRPGGFAVVVFSHPSFPQGAARVDPDGTRITYEWTASYFEPHTVTEPPWKHFTTEFVWFHRPLSTYWRSFVDAGFVVDTFEEPRLRADIAAVVHDQTLLAALLRKRDRPYSVAFRLVKPDGLPAPSPPTARSVPAAADPKAQRSDEFAAGG